MRRRATFSLLAVCSLLVIICPTCQAWPGFGEICSQYCRPGLSCTTFDGSLRCLCRGGRNAAISEECAKLFIDVAVRMSDDTFSLKYKIHVNGSFNNFSLTSTTLNSTDETCQNHDNCTFHSLSPGTLYRAQLTFTYHFQGGVKELKRTVDNYTHPAVPANIRHNETSDGVLQVSWDQRGNFSRARCTLDRNGRPVHPVKSSTATCRWPHLPLLKKFHGVKITVFNGQDNEREHKDIWDSPYATIPRIVKTHAFSRPSVTSVGLKLEEHEVNVTVGYYVIKDSSKNCYAYDMQNKTCDMPRKLRKCQERGSDSERTRIQTSSVLLTIEDLSPGTQYQFQLTPWFCNVTRMSGTTTKLEPVTTELFRVSGVSVSVNGTTLDVTWAPPPPTFRNAKVTVFLTDVTIVTSPGGPGRAVQGKEPTELCSVSYNSSNQASCQGRAPLAFWSYKVSVVAYMEQGNTTSEAVAVTTDMTAPGQVPRLNVMTLDTGQPAMDCDGLTLTNQSSACVTWETLAPRDRHGVVEHYEYTVTRDEKVVVTGRGRECSHGRDTGRVRHTLPTQCQAALRLVANCNYTLSIRAVSRDDLTGRRTTKSFAMPHVDPPPEPSPQDMDKAVPKEKVKAQNGVIHFVIQQPRVLLGPDSNSKLGEFLLVMSPGQHPQDYATPEEYPQHYSGWRDRQQALFNGTGYLVAMHSLAGNTSGSIPLVVGDEHNCTHKFCNGKLDPGKTYSVAVVTCNDAGCHPYVVVKNQTVSAEESERPPGGVYVGVAMGFGAVVGLLTYLACYGKTKLRKDDGRTNCTTDSVSAIGLDTLTAQRSPPPTRPMKLVSLEEAIAAKQLDEDAILCDEYEDISKWCKAYLKQVGMRSINLGKNRYADVIAYDHSRVKLTPNHEGSDYINANFLPGYSREAEYVAAQGPLPFTTPDFWRMVWEHKVHVIVMLTLPKENGKVKCEQYWPREVGEEEDQEGIMVATTSVTTLHDYNVTTITIKNTAGEERQVLHYHYLQWPDKTADVSLVQPVLLFVRDIRQQVEALPHATAPVLVHCSAGVGRTGCFICVDYVMQFIKNRPITDELDIYAFVMRLRDFRCLMVQTEEQYLFVHQCALALMAARRKTEGEASNGALPSVEAPPDDTQSGSASDHGDGQQRDTVDQDLKAPPDDTQSGRASDHGDGQQRDTVDQDLKDPPDDRSDHHDSVLEDDSTRSQECLYKP
ncbi:uncharacterized protein LOC143297802 [Babylonia areolata]|uniref:uncharacterized protein LOC143297802 n=1 Tax=Babylonia areolata TaxID=304850 RepID=UPI003FD37CC2